MMLCMLEAVKVVVYVMEVVDRVGAGAEAEAPGDGMHILTALCC